MTVKLSRKSRSATGTRRSLIAAVIALAVGWGGIVYAANHSVQGAKKEEGGFDGDAPTAILIEASSGSVLFEKNADELRAPSSMMKLMTAEVVFHAIKQGDVKLTDEYRVSENAWRKGGAPAGGSTMFAAINSKISVDDLLHGAIIQSGNDACMVLAEGIAGNERAFAEMMTKRARELGLTRSTFANSNGLPDPGNKMTVRELAKLARYIIQTYPDFYKLFGEKEFTWNKIRQQNRNPLLNSLEGADGLKTGYTKEGGYGMVGSAVQNGIRLIVVINGLDDPEDRASEAKKMLEWGFRNFEARTLFAAEQPVGYAKVFGGESRSVKLASHEPIKVMVQKNGTDKLIARVVYNGTGTCADRVGPAGRRGQGLARRQHRHGGAGLCGGIGRPGIDHAAGDRRRERTRDRDVSRGRREALTMAEAAVKRIPGRGRFITFEGGEGSGKSTQIKTLRRTPGRRKVAHHRHPRARRIAGRRNHQTSGVVRNGQAVGSGRGNAVVCGRARRPCAHRDRARAQAREYGCSATASRIRRGSIRAAWGRSRPPFSTRWSGSPSAISSRI